MVTNKDWERINELTLEDVISMGNDGYEFIIENGEIKAVVVPA